MKKHFLLSMVVMLLLWQPGFGQALLDKSGWSIQFQDEFNYSNNATLWSNWNWYDPYTDPATNLCGKEFCGQNQKYVQANTYVDGSGAVRIKTVDLSASMPVCGPTNSATAKYSQGAIWSKYMDNTYCSNGVGGFLYGMFEARIKMGKGAAKYGAFWLTGANAWPPEYDVFEFNGNTPNQFFSTPHWVSTNYQLASFNCSSSITIGTGVKSLTLPTNWSIQPGQQIVIVRDNSNWMAATVNSYSPSTGACVATVSSSPGGCTTWAGLGNSWDNVTCTYSGSGTYNSWRVDCRRGDCSCSTVYDKPTPGRLDEEYHTYTFVWTPSSVAWFFDGKEMRTDNYPDRIGTDCNWRKMVFGIGMGVNCPGALTSDEMYVDYVRVYKPTVSNVWNYKQYSSQVIDRTQHLLNVSEPANTAQSKMFVVNGPNNVFYRGTDNLLWNYYWTGSSWGNAPISWSVNDVGGYITWDGVNSRTYYRSTTGNVLKYFSGSSAYSTGLSNCAGWLAIDQFGKVFYKGTDSKIWNYYYNGSIWTSAIVSNNANVGGSITLDMAGGNVFYRGTDNNIWKVSWNSGTSSWNAAVQVTSGIAATDHLVWGVNSNRLYFRGSDSRIYNYYWTGSSWNTAALSYAAEDANCAGNLAYDNTRDILYYTGNDNRLWYYFNDRGWNTGTGTIYNTLANWNATNVTGPVIVRNDGVVYYRGSDNKLYENFNGDNLSDNPACSPGNYQVFKQGENEEQEEVSTTIIETPENTALLKVYPNPSRDIFNFELYIPDDQEGELFIYNLQSQRINMTEPVQHFNAGKNMITYDASALPAGVYYYSVQLKETVLTGRMIKN